MRSMFQPLAGPGGCLIFHRSRVTIKQQTHFLHSCYRQVSARTRRPKSFIMITRRRESSRDWGRKEAVSTSSASRTSRCLVSHATGVERPDVKCLNTGTLATFKVAELRPLKFRNTSRRTDVDLLDVLHCFLVWVVRTTAVWR